MKHIINQCLAAILSVAMAFSLLPAAAMAEESGEAPEQATVEQVQALIDTLPDADTITADNRADVEAQLTAIDEAKLELTEDEAAALDTTRYDAAVAALSALDTQTADPDPEPGALEQVQALIDALPDADTITAENRDDVEAQLTAIDEAKLALEDEELDTLDTTRYMAAVEAILALDDMAGADEPRTIATENSIKYMDWNSGQKKLEEKTCNTATTVESDTTSWSNNTWYVVSKDVTISSRITVSGTVHLILMDGHTLNAQKGITVNEHNSLTIYGQTGQSGTLSATGTGGHDASIGGGDYSNGGTITINGGNITAYSEESAGIGGASAGGDGGNITINGGNVTATSAAYGAGIGGGGTASGGTITINGGTVTASGGGAKDGVAGAGIGGGAGWKVSTAGGAGTIIITGGTVIAKGGSAGGAGIGDGSNNGATGTITITGGTITATGGTNAAGIGKSDTSNGSSSTFSTGANGSAVIHASISDTRKQSSWSGVFFDGNSGQVYGSPTPVENFEVKSGETLTIPNGTSLTVADGVTLTNNGELNIDNNGKIINSGTINVGSRDCMDATLNNEGTITNNNLIDVWGQLTNGEAGINNQNGGKIEYHFKVDVTASNFTSAQYGYSPQAQKITIKNTGELSATITNVEIIGDGRADFILNTGNNTKLETTGSTNESWTIQPVVGLSVGTHTATITVTYNGSGIADRTATAKVTFTVIKATSTVTVSASDDPTYGSDITLTAEVTATGVGPGEINGEVTFKAGNVELGKARAENGTATLVIKDTDTDKQKAIFDNNTQITAKYAGNDSIEEGTGTGTVTVKQKPLTFAFNATDRTYDTTTKVEGSFDVKGKVDGDNVNVSDYTANVEDKDVGNAKGVTAEVTGLGGADAKYYKPGAVDGGTVEITQATLELTIPAVSITYGTKLTNDLLSSGGTAKIQGVDNKTIEGTFAWDESAQGQMPAVSDSNETTYKVVFTPSSPEKAENFTTESLNKRITVTVKKATPTVTVDGVNGQYGENVVITAKVAVSDVAASNITGTVEFKVGGTSLGTANIENGEATLTVQGSEQANQHALFGVDGSSTVTAKYSGDGNITEGSGIGNVSMEKRALTYDVTATDRVYDGKTDVTVSLSPTNLVGTDSVTLTATGNLSSPNAATYNQVDLTEVSINDGGDAKYYSVESTASNKDLTTDVTISKATVKFDVSGNSLSYTGSDQKATVTKTAPVGLELAEATDYEVYYTAQNAENTTGGTKDGKTDAGTYDVWVKLTKDTYKNYMFADDKQEAKVGELTISKVLATCVAPTANNSTYTGGTQALVGAGAHTGGTMMYALGESGSVEPGDEKFSETIPSETDAGKYYVWYYVKADTNHTDSAKGYVEVTIKKAEVTFTVTGNDVPYDTNAHTATVTQTEGEVQIPGDGYTVVYANSDSADSTGGTADKTEAGTYDIWVKLNNDNFKFKEKDDTTRELKLTEKLTINQAALILNVTGSDITYGQTLSESKLSGKATISGGTEITGNWAWDEAVASSYPTVTGSNSYKVTFKPSNGAENFTDGSKSTTITIEVKPFTLTPQVDSVEGKEYDGTTTVTGSPTLKFAEAEQLKQAPFSGNLPSATGTFEFTDKNVGKNKSVKVTGITISAAEAGNYQLSTTTIESAETSAEITAKEVELTWSSTTEFTYNGEEQGVTVTVNTGVDGESLTAELKDNMNTDAGKYTAEAIKLNDGENGEAKNYKLPEANTKAYTIKKATVSVEAITKELTYTTQPQTVGTVTVNTSGAPALTQGSDYKVVYTAKDAGDSADGTESKTDVGEYDIWVVLESENAKKNYEFAGAKATAKVGTLTVNKAKLDLTVIPVTLTYGTALNNAQLTGSTAKIEGENGATITGTWTWENAGVFPAVSDSKSTKYKVTFTPDTQFAGNFVETTLSKEVTITVNKYELTPVVVASSVDSKTYDGNTTVTGGELEFTDMGIFNNAPFNGTKPTISGAFAYTGPNAGTNTVNVTDIHFDKNGENYSLSTDKIDSSTVDGAIAAKEVTLSWALDGGAELTTGYTGAEHTVTATATTGVGSETVNVTVTGGTQTNAGSYIATASALTNGENGGLAANYKLPSDVTQEYTITPAPVSFTIGGEDKVNWATRGETNADPNPTGYALEGSGTEYALSMTYDSYNHKAAVTQKAGEAVKIEAGTTNGYTVTYRKDGAAEELTEIRDAGTYEIWVTLTPTDDNIYNYTFVGQDEDVYSLKIGEITIEPYTVHVTWSHLKYVYHAHKMHPNVRVQNAFKADVQPDVVPDGFDPAVGYSGELLAFAETSGTDVGNYDVEVELYGTSAGNYTVDDNTETVTIVPAPVTFTVGDNIWVIGEGGALSRNTVTLRPAWGAVSTTPDVAVHHSYPSAGTALDLATLDVTIEYWQNGEKVVSPSEAGKYEVWVKIGNINYRHSATETGELHHVGELVITDDPDSITTYTVTFDPGYEGAPDGPVAIEKVFPNQTVVLPPVSGENVDGTKYDLTRTGYSFLGWSYNGHTYQPNEELHMPAADVTFKGEWIEAVQVGGRVVQESSGGEPTPVSGATVVLKQGSEPTAEAVTGSDGTFDFGLVMPGIYNLEVTYENGGGAKIVKTFLIEVGDSGSVDNEFVLPDTALNTVVEVAPGIKSAVSMDGMIIDETAADVYTESDKKTVAEGGTVEFKMSISETTLTDDQGEEIPAPEERISMVLDMELTKTVTEKGGPSGAPVQIHDSKIPVTTVIHLPAEIQGKSGYTVYRFHDTDGDGIDEMQTITTSPNENGEYLEVIRDGTAIELHAEFYSTYVLTWNQITNSSYRITLPAATENGRLTADRTMASRGRTVTLTATPDEGCHLRSLTVTDKNGKPVELTAGGDGTYTFVQPASRVTVEAEFVKCLSAGYEDIDLDAWYHEYTDRVIESGLMLGVGDGIFAPNGTVTRAQMVTALWHMSGDAETDYDMDYTDVSEGDWYAEAVRWATGAGVAGGYGNGKFGPNDPITREQMATMLYRYEQNLGDGGFTGEWMYRLPFTDLEDISDWAFEAVAWCNMEEIVLGREDDTFDPQGEAKRSEMAAVLTRWSETNEK